MSMGSEHGDFGGEMSKETAPRVPPLDLDSEERMINLYVRCDRVESILLEYRGLVDRIRSARNLRDWDEVNMAVRELCELESEFRK